MTRMGTKKPNYQTENKEKIQIGSLGGKKEKFQQRVWGWL